MSRDPWADDWDADWSKSVRATASSNEIWSQANNKVAPQLDLSDVTPKVAYKPQIKILKRDPSASSAGDSKQSAERVAVDQVSKEARYREARDRLFGPSVASSPAQSRCSSPSTQFNSSVNPVRQSKGPEESGRGGFANRGKVRVLHFKEDSENSKIASSLLEPT